MSSDRDLFYTARARKDLRNLDKRTARRIVIKVKENAFLDDPLDRARPLRGVFEGLYRYRVGDYRIVFQIDNTDSSKTSLIVLMVANRKDVYEG